MFSLGGARGVVFSRSGRGSCVEDGGGEPVEGGERM